MTQWKDTLEVQKESLKVGIAETQFSFFQFIRAFPPVKRWLLYLLAITFIPAIIGVRIGTQYYTEWQLK